MAQKRYTVDHDVLCPNCGQEAETCMHGLNCEEESRVEALLKSVELLDR